MPATVGGLAMRRPVTVDAGVDDALLDRHFSGSLPRLHGDLGRRHASGLRPALGRSAGSADAAENAARSRSGAPRGEGDLEAAAGVHAVQPSRPASPTRRWPALRQVSTCRIALARKGACGNAHPVGVTPA